MPSGPGGPKRLPMRSCRELLVRTRRHFAQALRRQGPGYHSGIRSRPTPPQRNALTNEHQSSPAATCARTPSPCFSMRKPFMAMWTTVPRNPSSATTRLLPPPSTSTGLSWASASASASASEATSATSTNASAGPRPRSVVQSDKRAWAAVPAPARSVIPDRQRIGRAFAGLAPAGSGARCGWRGTMSGLACAC